MRTTTPDPFARVKVTAAHTRANTAEADWRSTLARSGLVAKGILYAAVGVLAIQMASGGAGSESASKRGAIELVASQPFGQWLLGLLTAGLFALAIWQIILAFKGDPVEGSEAWDRARFAGKGVVYLGTAMTALSILLSQLGSGAAGALPGGGGAGSEERATSTVMSWPAGPWIVGLLGLAIIGAAIYQIHAHGWNTKFMQRLSRAQMGTDVGTNVERVGRIGYAARAVVLAIAGVFLVVAALQHDPQEAVGLSGALRTIAGQPWGEALLWFVAVGLFLFGCFSLAEAKYRRAT